MSDVSLESLLGLDLTSPTQIMALEMAENDAYLIRNLIAVRKSKGLTQREVADSLGLSQATIAAFESYDNDPKLSTIRRYALAIGVLVHHEVESNRFDVSEGWTRQGPTRAQRLGAPSRRKVLDMETPWIPVAA